LRFIPLELAGAHLVESDPFVDQRGAFTRLWCRDEFRTHGLDPGLEQISSSRNTRAGTLRGLHFQRPPDAETKLVRCTRGAIYDVIVDLRPESPTFMRWLAVSLEESMSVALYIPKGFAHGFQTLVDGAEVLYMISQPYAAESAAGVRWDDPTLGITWPETPTRTISERDLGWPNLAPRTPG
jgi:dTDP-4-dehydrorhamnose 3,5-epimerase